VRSLPGFVSYVPRSNETYSLPSEIQRYSEAFDSLTDLVDTASNGHQFCITLLHGYLNSRLSGDRDQYAHIAAMKAHLVANESLRLRGSHEHHRVHGINLELKPLSFHAGGSAERSIPGFPAMTMHYTAGPKNEKVVFLITSGRG
jgi:hypothetical protein